MNHKIGFTTVQINAITCPKANTIIYDTELGYDVIYDGTRWIKFIKPRVRWFVRKGSDRIINDLLITWERDHSFIAKRTSFIDYDYNYTNYFYDLRPAKQF